MKFWLSIIFLLLCFGLTSPLHAREIKLAFAGDVMLGRFVGEKIAAGDGGAIWGNARSLLADADATFVNHEFVLTSSRKEWNPQKAFHFRAAPMAVSVLKSAGIDWVSLGNNHALDYDAQGLRDTLNELNKNNIVFGGAGTDITGAKKISTVMAGVKKIAVIAFTDNEPASQATADSPGVFYLPVNSQSANVVAGLAADARKGGADIVILSVHWGGNWNSRPPAAFRSFAHEVLDRGVDIIHGHSTHTIQGIEVYKGKIVFYGMGDVMDDYAVDSAKRNDLSFIAHVFLDEMSGKISRIEVNPVKNTNMQLNRAAGSDEEWVVSTLQKLSEEMDTHLKVQGNQLVLAF